MPNCEKCWGKAYTRSRCTGRGQATCYSEILKEVEASGILCTPEEQAGVDAQLCKKCNRKSVHQVTGDCTNPECEATVKDLPF